MEDLALDWTAKMCLTSESIYDKGSKITRDHMRSSETIWDHQTQMIWDYVRWSQISHLPKRGVSGAIHLRPKAITHQQRYMCCLRSIYTIDTIYAVYGKLYLSSPKSSETSSFFKPHTFNVSVHEEETYMDNVRLSKTENKQAAGNIEALCWPNLIQIITNHFLFHILYIWFPGHHDW